jgi:HNH endonuclease
MDLITAEQVTRIRYDIKYSPEPNSGCWLWLASVDKYGYGYGRLRHNGKWTYAHIVEWEKVNGPVPEGMELDHKCKIKPCCNPSHLELVTHAINVQRAAKLTIKDVLEIRKRCELGESYESLGLHYNVDKQHIYAIAKRIYWKNI